jgi:ABC-type glycerol-3-phosphate transport system permease component
VARPPLGIRVLLHALLLLAAVLTLAPYAWMVSSSFKPHAEIFSATLELVPRRPIVDNYVVAVTREPTLRAIGNSLVMAGAETLAVVGARPLRGRRGPPPPPAPPAVTLGPRRESNWRARAAEP